MKKTVSSKKNLFLILTILLVIILAGFVGVRSGALKLKLTTTKTNLPKDFKIPSSIINPPKDWKKVTPNTKAGEMGHFESNEIDIEKVEGGNLTTNAIIRVKVSSGYKSLDDFVNQYKATGAKNDRFQILSSTNNSLNGENGYLLESTFETKVGSQKLLVHQLDYLFYKDGTGFLVEGFSSDSSWTKHADEIKTSLDTFRFK